MAIKVNPVPQSGGVPMEEKRLEAGLLGRLWGTSTNAPVNIAGLLSMVLVSTFFLVWAGDKAQAISYLEKVAPMITLTLGYLFGKKS